VLEALHPLIADGFRLRGEEHNPWEKSLEVLRSACQPQPCNAPSVPAATALAGPRHLCAPSTRAQRTFLQVLLSSIPRGTAITLLQLLQLPILLSPCCSPAVLAQPGTATSTCLRWLQVLLHAPEPTQHRGASTAVLSRLSGYPEVACSIEAPR